MTTKEAVALLERYSNYDGMGIPNLAGCKEAMRVAVDTLKEACPELAESEDERIRKAIVGLIEELQRSDKYFAGVELTDMLAYLEKQKEKEKYDRMQPIYDNLDSFESALAKAWKAYNDSGARTVDGCEDDYVECAHAKGFREGYLFGIEKRKEQKPADDKAFEEWIDDWWKHNKVNNPDSYDKGDEIQFDKRGFKNFCRGIRNMYQQKPAEWSEEDKENINSICSYLDSYCRYHEKDGYGVEECKIRKDWLKSLRPQKLDASKLENFDPVDVLNRIKTEWSMAWEKVVGNTEWSQQDKRKLQKCIEVVERWERDLDIAYAPYSSMLKSLRPQPHWKPSEEQIKALEDAFRKDGSDEYRKTINSLYQDLKKL